MNLSTMAGVFILQSVTGAIVGLFDSTGGAYPVDAYRAVFAFQALGLSIALCVYLFAYDPLREARTSGS